jgi:transposase
MRDRDLYARILGLESPWKVSHVELLSDVEEVEVFVEVSGSAPLPCPECGAACGRHDHRKRRWRHLDTCQFKTTIVGRIPRVNCAEHGVHQVAVPWSESGSGFTALFEGLVIDWLLDAPIAAVARKLRVTWDQRGYVLDSSTPYRLWWRPAVGPRTPRTMVA